ncbi:hypothetical protein ACHAXT_007710 [Thalassiosira profunda]
MHHAQNKPVVVLLGWLGCQPRNLRRYREMYESVGWDALTRIASPSAVVAAMTEAPSDLPTQSEMGRLAIDILQELQRLQPPQFILHIFSNNGCFIWEWIRFILFHRPALLSAIDPKLDANELRQRFIGIVFDSAPAHYDGRSDALESALAYVSPLEERNRLVDKAKSLDHTAMKRRFADFWGGLLNDPTDIPQLYLYSQCDELASAKRLEELISYRESVLRKANIWMHRFPDSEHCGHLLKCPEMYDRLVKQFLGDCARRSGFSTIGSKL